MHRIHDIMFVLVKDGVPNLRNEDVEIVETNDTPPPVPDTPSRIPYATPINEEEEDFPHSINKSSYEYDAIFDRLVRRANGLLNGEWRRVGGRAFLL